MNNSTDISGWTTKPLDWYNLLENCRCAVIKLTQPTQYRITHLAGQCRSGSDSRGHVTHLVSGWKAACGKEPGKRSAGWSEYNDSEITCQKCKRLASTLPAQTA